MLFFTGENNMSDENEVENIRQLRPSDAIKIFANQYDQVCVKSEDDENVYLVLNPHDIPLVCRWLREVAAECRGRNPDGLV